jgi:hypothetical protein
MARALHKSSIVLTHLGCDKTTGRLHSHMSVSEGNSVIEKLGFLVRFWELKARHATLGQPLAPQEQIELLSLMQLVTGDFKLPEAGPVQRTRGALPAQIIGEGAITPIEIRNVSAAALLVASATRMAVGSRVIVRVADAVSGVEITLPCFIEWAWEGAPCTMALIVDGIPTRSDFASPPDAHARSALAMGRRERLVG